MSWIQVRMLRLVEAQVCSLVWAQVGWKLTFTRLHPTPLPGACSQFSKTSEKSSPTTSPYPPPSAFLLAFEYSSDGVQKDVQKFGSQRSRALLKETKFGGGERWRGFLWLCAVLFLTVWRIVFISVCLQSLSVNIFALLIWNSPALSGFHLAEPPSPTCFLIH